MKIVLILNALFKPNIGGVENSIAEMTDLLVRLNNHVDIVCSSRNNESNTTLEPFEQNKGYNVYRYNYAFGKLSFIRNLLNSTQLLRKLKKENSYDYIISRNYLLVIASKISGLSNIKYIPPEVTFYSSKSSIYNASLKNFLSYYFKTFLQSLALFISDEVFVFSDTMIEQTKKISLRLVTVKKVEPGVNLEKFSPSDTGEKTDLRNFHSIPQNKTVILALGRYSELKQYDLAILAMQHLDERFLLLLVGSGPELNNYKELISNYCLESKVKIVDSTNNPQDFYSLSDAFLMISKYESFGQTILEAAATKLKIIAFSRKSGVNTNTESMLSDYNHLFLVDEQSALQLSKGILSAFSNPDDCNRTTSLNKNLITERYSWRQFLKNIGIAT